MLKQLKSQRRMLMVLSGALLGLILLALSILNRQTPERTRDAIAPRSVNVIETRLHDMRLEARGYGIAGPAETWQAVANVPGRVVARHPALENGSILEAGALLVALDPGRYELAIEEARAELLSLSAELEQLETEADNTRRLLDLESERLALSEQELTRIEQLAEREAVSQANLDTQRRATLSQRQAVASLENTLALIPARRDVLNAQMARVNSRLDQARQDLADTRFVAPYDLRLHDVNVEMHQYAGAGQPLFSADSLEAAEVEARIPFSMMRRLLGSVADAGLNDSAMDLSERLDLSLIDAELQLVGAEGVSWTGQLVRVANGLDPATRAVRIVVRVDDPYGDVQPPDRPPLQRDMYVRVRLTSESPEQRLAVPASAVHQEQFVYRVTEENRLDRRQVRVDFTQGDLAVIADGIAAGDRIIVDDLSPAINGMALSPRRDEALEARVRETAEGAGQ